MFCLNSGLVMYPVHCYQKYQVLVSAGTETETVQQ